MLYPLLSLPNNNILTGFLNGSGALTESIFLSFITEAFKGLLLKKYTPAINSAAIIKNTSKKLVIFFNLLIFSHVLVSGFFE